MAFTTRQMGPCFAAEVDGLDLREPLSSQDVVAIHTAMHASFRRPQVAVPGLACGADCRVAKG